MSKTLECVNCHYRTTDIEAKLRNYRTGFCGKCGYGLNEVTEPTPDTELDRILAKLYHGSEKYTYLPDSPQLEKAKQSLIAWSNKRTRDIAEQIIGSDEDLNEPLNRAADGNPESDKYPELYIIRRAVRNISRADQRQTLNTLLGE